MACVVKTGKVVNGREETAVERYFTKDAIQIQIHKGIGHNNKIIGAGKPEWPKLSPIPVLSVGKSEKVGIGNVWPVRVYWRDDKTSYGVLTHTLISVGSGFAITPDINAPDKISDGGMMANALLVAYLESKEAEDYLQTDREHLNKAIAEFKDIVHM